MPCFDAVCTQDCVQFPTPIPCSSAEYLQISPVPFKLKLPFKPNFPQINFLTAETNYYWNLSQIELSGWDFRYPLWDLNNFWFSDWALTTDANIKYCPQNVTTRTRLRLRDFVILSVIVSFGYFLTCLPSLFRQARQIWRWSWYILETHETEVGQVLSLPLGWIWEVYPLHNK